METERKPNGRAKLIVLSLIFTFFVIWGAAIVLFAAFIGGLSLTFAGAATVIIYLILLSVSAWLAPPTKLWAKSLPFQTALYIIVPLFFRWFDLSLASETAGQALLSVFLVEPLRLPDWTCIFFTAIEAIAIQALGIGIRALCRKFKETYGGIPF